MLLLAKLNVIDIVTDVVDLEDATKVFKDHRHRQRESVVIQLNKL